MNNGSILDHRDTGIGEIRFHASDANTLAISVSFCEDGFWSIPSSLVVDCAIQARASNRQLSFHTFNPPENVGKNHVSIVFQTGDHVPEYLLTAKNNCSPAKHRFLCIIGEYQTTVLHGFDGICIAQSWDAAIAVLRLLTPAHGLVGYGVDQAIDFLTGNVTTCEIWRCEDPPSPTAVNSDAVWLHFSNRLLVTEVCEASDKVQMAMGNSIHVSFSASVETMSTLSVDALMAKAAEK